jgi:hypothetical protein
MAPARERRPPTRRARATRGGGADGLGHFRRDEEDGGADDGADDDGDGLGEVEDAREVGGGVGCG